MEASKLLSLIAPLSSSSSLLFGAGFLLIPFSAIFLKKTCRHRGPVVLIDPDQVKRDKHAERRKKKNQKKKLMRKKKKNINVTEANDSFDLRVKAILCQNRDRFLETAEKVNETCADLYSMLQDWPSPDYAARISLIIHKLEMQERVSPKNDSDSMSPAGKINERSKLLSLLR